MWLFVLPPNFRLHPRDCQIAYESKRLSSLGRLSASIAHEVKNPLSSIKAITQVLKEELPSNDSNQEGLTLIIEEIDRLSRVVKQLLLFARPRSHIFQNINISEILENVMLLLKHEADRKQVEIKNITAPDLKILSDKTKIIWNI